jgi:hypothetical protein
MRRAASLRSAVAALAVAGLVVLGTPAEPRAQTSVCGTTGGSVCTAEKTCERKWLIFKECTTTYTWWDGTGLLV